MSFILLLGATGRMNQALQEVLTEANEEFRIRGPHASGPHQFQSWQGCLGVIDFTTPEASISTANEVLNLKIPYVCGTTGWSSTQVVGQIFQKLSQAAPVVVDSNFSLGVELTCQAGAKVFEALEKEQSNFSVSIHDIHHQHKKDSPSGTALKIKDRLLEKNSRKEIRLTSARIGEVAGEHQILFSWPDEEIIVTHRALSRKLFARGALQALRWAQNQKPGFYSMRDVLK